MMRQADGHRAGPKYSLLFGSRDRPQTQVFIVNGLVGRGGKGTVKSISLRQQNSTHKPTFKNSFSIVGQ